MASGRRWEVEFTPEAERWFNGLGAKDADRIGAAIEQLRRHGPNLGRPRADSIRGSRHHNMKELRSAGRHLRVLFVLDPRQRAVILVGGDKTNDWKGWYRRNIRIADKLYDRHLRSIGKGERWPTRTRTGERSASSGR
ncbi:MAG TPA: type II toxin-antitoxin system RelE/ParE family toxin [Solirubrobacteraceae bacterium]|nr:type II toxin-antitoxin system RelE/ParE family toxin [Solirubrobacteraceae bacterium]